MHLLRVVSLLGVLLAAPAIASIQPTNWSRAGTQTDDFFGRSVAPAGDVDRDGYGDLLVGPRGSTPR